ncbi:MAG: type II secretion system protein GspG [Planctomycetaceae bacterium]|jgi:general secretion pathway protein G|nr:type II secretion system protein GspG [Planctomycetaceae bacterium]
MTKTKKNMLLKLNWKRQRGFTLIELLIVLAILVVIMAMLLPLVFRRYNQSLVKQARLEINSLDAALSQYNVDTGSFPTLEQGGLQALISRPQVTVNAMTAGQPTANPATPFSGNPQPGQQGFSAPFPDGAGGAGGFGGDMGNGFGGYGNPTMPPMGNPQGNNSIAYAPQGQFGQSPNPNMGMPMMGTPTGTPNMGADPTMGGNMGMPGMGTDPTMGGNMGMPSMGTAPAMGGSMGMPSMGTDPTMGGNMGMPSMGMDPAMGGGMGMPGMMGTAPAMGGGTGNMNPQILALKARRAAAKWDGPYWSEAVIPDDPWGKPYHYEYPTNRTFGGKPAVWSEGPDKTDGTEDDVCNYSLEETQFFNSQHQSQTGVNPANPAGTLPSPNYLTQGVSGVGGTGMSPAPNGFPDSTGNRGMGYGNTGTGMPGMPPTQDYGNPANPLNGMPQNGMPPMGNGF